MPCSTKTDSPFYDKTRRFATSAGYKVCKKMNIEVTICVALFLFNTLENECYLNSWCIIIKINE